MCQIEHRVKAQLDVWRNAIADIGDERGLVVQRPIDPLVNRHIENLLDAADIPQARPQKPDRPGWRRSSAGIAAVIALISRAVASSARGKSSPLDSTTNAQSSGPGNVAWKRARLGTTALSFICLNCPGRRDSVFGDAVRPERQALLHGSGLDAVVLIASSPEEISRCAGTDQCDFPGWLERRIFRHALPDARQPADLFAVGESAITSPR